jgi:hypothetical protein
LAAGALACLVGCASREAPSFEDWRAETSAVCLDYEARMSEFDDKFEDLLAVDTYLALLSEASEVAGRYLDALLAVDVPSSRRDEIERLNEDVDALRSEWAALDEAAVAGDAGTVEGISEQMEARVDGMNAAAEALGVPECIAGEGES